MLAERWKNLGNISTVNICNECMGFTLTMLSNMSNVINDAHNGGGGVTFALGEGRRQMGVREAYKVLRNKKACDNNIFQ